MHHHVADSVVQDTLSPSSGSALKMPPASAFAGGNDVLPQALHPRAYLGSNGFNATAVLAARQEYQIQVIASTFSSCSVLAALCAIYWFWMMRRNFRRDLVLLLICGDLWKSFWFLVFSSTSLAHGRISTDSSFCQASGYFLQLGVEACDIAVVLMSLHMQLQIFPPRDSFLGHDGLYRLRHVVLGCWFIIPNVVVSLAFLNDHTAFVSQGGFCTLPIRPFWYRLALSWIPRYLVWTYILFVAIKIYRHVGYEFKVFGEERDRSSSINGVGSASSDPSPVNAFVPRRRSPSTSSDAAATEKHAGADDGIAPDDEVVGPSSPAKVSSPASALVNGFNLDRRQSVPVWTTPFSTGELEHLEGFAASKTSQTKSNPSSRRGSRQLSPADGVEDSNLPRSAHFDSHKGSISTTASFKTMGAHSYDQSQLGLGTITEQKTKESTGPPTNAANKAMQKRRKAIQRQLRLLFIYPCVYLLMWVIPLVSHALSYNNHFAQHPVFPIAALSIFFQVTMGTVDAIIFCWREKPWHHIPGSDGTFIGSFLFWRFAFGSQWVEQRRKSTAPATFLQARDNDDADEDEQHTQTSQNALLRSLKRWSLSLSSKSPSARPSQSSIPATAGFSSPPPVRRSAPPPTHRRQHSGGSGRRVREAERAHERLALERADYQRQQQQQQRSLHARSTSALEGAGSPAVAPTPTQTQTQQQQQTGGPASRREWWDRHMSITNDDF